MRSHRAILTAAVITAVMLTASTSFVVLAQDASASPEASASLQAIPSPAADAFPAPTEVSPAPTGWVVEDAGMDGEPRRLVVEAGDLWFGPNEITIRSDEPTVLVLSGVGTVAHNLMIDDLDVQLNVGPGTEAEVSLSDVPPGEYEFYCAIFGHRRGGMYGTLTVE